MAKDKKTQDQQENEANRLLSRISASVNKHLLPPADQFGEAGCKDLLDKYPLLHTAMFATFQEGGPAEGCTLILWGSERGVTVLVSLKWLKAKAYFCHDSLSDALQAIEEALGDPEFKWQSDRPKHKRSGRSKGYGSHRG